MVLAPVAPIFVAFFGVESVSRFRKSKDETGKVLFAVLAIILLIASIFIFVNFNRQVKAQAYGFVPSYYTFQWQKAMQWTRENTPKDAVFAHWWDYGYWVQSIGERATVTDGGNVIVYWNYLSGRFVLTGDNQKDALEFLYTHNATHLLIDSSDLGKYGAFASIGSNENYDRFSSGPAILISDKRAIREMKNATIRDYNMPAGGGRISIYPLEEDIFFNKNGSEINLLKENAGFAGISITTSQENNSISFKNAEAIFISSNNMVTLPLRYIYYNGKLIDFGEGINAAAYIMPRVSSEIDDMGAAMYISPRLIRGLLSQIYILNDAFGNFKNFKLAHSEPSVIAEQINYNINEFFYIDGGGVMGPIKIWEIKYNGDEKVNPDYLDTDYSKYISWQL